jgi:hypothetical protein
MLHYQVNRSPFQHALWSDVSLLCLLFLWWFLSLSWVLHDLNKPHSVLFHAFSFSSMWTDWKHREGNLTLRWDLRRMALTAEVALVVKSPPANAGSVKSWTGLKWFSTEHTLSHLEARKHWWLWHFLSTDMAGNIFISQAHSRCSINISWINIWVNSLSIIKERP